MVGKTGGYRRRARIPQGGPFPIIRKGRSRRLGTKQNRPPRAVNRRAVRCLMNVPASTKPATAATVNGLQGDRLGRRIGSIANPTFRPTQGAYRLIRAHWIVVRQNNGWREQQLAILKAAEESERNIIRQLVGSVVGGGRT
jgi:hypothetical protein